MAKDEPDPLRHARTTHAGWLERAVDGLRHHACDFVGGPVLPIGHDDDPGGFALVAYPAQYGSSVS